MRYRIYCLFLILGIFANCGKLEEPSGVLEVNFEKLEGLWFDIAHLPNELQADCTNTTILNSSVTKNSMRFVYECFREGWWENYRGSATRSPDHPALIQLDFDDDPNGHYAPKRHWLLAEARDGSWIVVGDPQNEALWIYARTFRVDSKEIENIKQTLVKRNHFHHPYLNRKLIFTSHQ